jgi:hypothetical protein
LENVRLWVLVLATGCGRLGFDATADAFVGFDAPAGHDEDGDGVPDTLDDCPHLPDPGQADLDGDGVGDPCDPEPDLARQRIAVFQPFVGGGHPGLTLLGTWTAEADSIHSATDGGGIQLDLAAPAASVSFGLTVVSRGTGPWQILVRPYATVPNTYAELYDDGTGRAKITHYDGTNYTAEGQIDLAGSLHTGDLTWDSLFDGLAHTETLTAGWPGEPYTVSGPAPELTSTSQILAGFGSLEIDLRYVAVIVTTP